MLPKAKRITRLQLTRNPTAALRAVQEGDTVIVEEQGQPAVALVDFIDLQILQAIIAYYTRDRDPESTAELPATELEGLEGQPLFDRVMALYLSTSISLGRAAEALDIPWVELRGRLTNLGVSVWTGPTDAAGIRRDADVAESLAS